MDFKKELELLRWLAQGVSLKKGEFSKGLTFDNINSSIADYINHYYSIGAKSETREWECSKVKTTQHDEKIYLDIPSDHYGAYEKSYFMPLREFIYDYHERIIEDIMEENNLFQEKYYEMLEDGILDDEIDLQEPYELYLIEKFASDYIDYLTKWGDIHILIEKKRKIKSGWMNYFKE